MAAPVRMETLDSRIMLAVRTVDFDEYPVRFDQLDFLMPDVGPQQGGFTYGLGTADGQRTPRYGVTWPDAAYYDQTLGAGGFDALNTWAMRPTVIYTTQRNGNWLTSGWHLYQDMAEGAACVDDTARGATALMEDYLRNGTESSFQRARDALTFISYLMGRDGRMYNFVFLDAPEFFDSDPYQRQNLHYGYRAEYVKRTEYPPGTGDTSWLNPHIDPAHIVGWPSPQAAPPFLPHARYSIYMNDLRDGSNNDVAATWLGPIYTASGAPNGYQPGKLIKQTYTTSHQQFGFEEARTIEAYGKAMLMLAKRSSVNGGLSADETFFARFIENHANRLLRNLQRQSLTAYDSKLQSVLVAGLVDYYRVMHATSPYGPYMARLAADSGTPGETTDDRLSASAILSMIDTLTADIRGELFKTSDWRNGIFIANRTAGNWAAWGEFQIAALSKAYQLKRSLGQTGAPVEALLNDAVYAAENFYGKEGWHYAAPGANNVRTKERTNYIQGWGAYWHTNSDQSGYYNSSIVHGLAELAEAYAASGRSDATAKRDLYLDYMKTAATWWIGNNNMLLDVYDGQGPVEGATRGRGASFDGIAHGNGAPWFNRNSGGESNIEGLRTMIVVKDTLARYNRPTTFSFETGPNRLPAGQSPQVVSATFDPGARAVRFRFNKDVGASVDRTDLTLVNLDAGGAAVPRSAITAVAYNSATFELTYRFTSALADANYRATLGGVGIVDNFSSVMLAHRAVDFFALAGDANGDRHVDQADRMIVTANYGHAGTFADGDFSGDGTVGPDDLAILDARWLLWLPPRGSLDLSVGTAGPDTIRLRRGPSTLDVYVGPSATSPTYRIVSGVVGTLWVSGGAGDDTVILDQSGGVVHSDIRLTGGTGNDVLTIVGTTSSLNLHVQTDRVLFDGSPVWLNGVESVELRADSGAAIPVGSLTVAGRLTIARGGQHALDVAGALVITTGTLDLTDNAMVVRGGDVGSWNGQGYTGLTGSIRSGLNGGAWNGIGIVTSEPDAIGGRRSLGIALAQETGHAGGLFQGVPVATGDVLIMHTAAGDANLSGHIDPADYLQINGNYGQAGAPGFSGGWHHGDFNYDGRIDGDDYATIDAAFAVQQIQHQEQPPSAQTSPASEAPASLPDQRGQLKPVTRPDVDQPNVIAGGGTFIVPEPARQADRPPADLGNASERHKRPTGGKGDAPVDRRQRQGGLSRNRIVIGPFNPRPADAKVVPGRQHDLTVFAGTPRGHDRVRGPSDLVAEMDDSADKLRRIYRRIVRPHANL